ncbi:SpoIIE family protein phosphatase [Streptomyces sp. Lzd4kr]|nr:SpoIIE family protein phosphatase [Streptomyces sp. Lzd4kr]
MGPARVACRGASGVSRGHTLTRTNRARGRPSRYRRSRENGALRCQGSSRSLTRETVDPTLQRIISPRRPRPATRPRTLPLPPLGLGLDTSGPPTEHHTRLQPGDRILLYSDGVIEARTTKGTLFGEQRLGDTVIRSMTSGDNAPETLRRLVQNIHHDHQLRDDATLLLAHWHPT